MRLKHWVTLAAAGLSLTATLSAFAFTGNTEHGKSIFMTKGSNGKACMTCHPKGLTTGDTYKGKDIPDLTEKPLSANKIQKKTLKFLQYQGMNLSDRDLADLLAFVEGLPSRGFGPVPPAWQSYVKQKVVQ